MKPLPLQSSVVQERAGMALVIVLALVVLVTGIVTAYLTQATANREISEGDAAYFRTDQLADMALESIIADLKGEIAAGSDSNGLPKEPAAVVPCKVETAPDLPNLLKKSCAGVPFYKGTQFSAAPVERSSRASTGTPSLNRRFISKADWNKPQLMSEEAFANSFTPPDWVIVTEEKIGVGENVDPRSLSDPSSSSFAIGRFAYTMYDVGGLININCSGLHSAAPLSAAERGQKGLPSLIELDKLPLATGEFGAASADTLVQWRDAATFSTGFPDDLKNMLLPFGFSRVSKGNNTFQDRQDLIAWQMKHAAQCPPESLQYLTVFSREVNAPSFVPLSVNSDNYPFHQFKKTDGTLLLRRRFPLTRLEWITSSGPAAGRAEEIRKFFGLQWHVTDKVWVYTSPDTPATGSPTPASSILTLSQIPANRDPWEPDFFELLQAAIKGGHNGSTPLGSLGSSAGITAAASDAPDSNTYLQILRIGANIIDQADPDSYPTTVRFRFGTLDVSAFGLESLPYLNEIFLKPFAPDDNTGTAIRMFVICEFWNPHQSATTNAGPRKVRARATSGGLEWMLVGPGGTWYRPPVTVFPQAGGEVVADISTVSRAESYLNPKIPTDTPKTGLGMNAIELPSLTLTTAMNQNAAGAYSWKLAFRFRLEYGPAMYVLEYEDAAGTWRPYSSFTGVPEIAGTGLRTDLIEEMAYRGELSRYISDPAVLPFSYVKSDPRTTRYGSSWSYPAYLGVPRWNPDPRMGLKGNTSLREGTLFPAPDGNTFGYRSNHQGIAASASVTRDPNNLYLGMLASNNTAALKIADRDQVFRPGDAFRGGNPLSTNSSSKPVIMNRPFRSVGELGYVFRDSPWKTLDLFSRESADSGLMDYFCISEAENLAGKVSLNTRHPEVLQTLLAGVNRDAGGNPLGRVEAAAIANDLVALTRTSPLVSKTDLLNRTWNYSGTIVNAQYPEEKTRREAIIRALAENGSTRTWNLLIDLIAQTGVYPRSSNPSLDRFTVMGQRRYWLHLAIDRFTGKVVDRRLEVITD